MVPHGPWDVSWLEFLVFRKRKIWKKKREKNPVFFRKEVKEMKSIPQYIPVLFQIARARWVAEGEGLVGLGLPNNDKVSRERGGGGGNVIIDQ